MKHLRFTTILLGLLFASVFSSQAQSGYEISVQLDGFAQDELYLAYYYGNKQFIRDTVRRGEKGAFVFQNDEPLPGGVYLVVMPPDNQYFQILIDEGDQHFGLRARTDDITGSIRFEGSFNNEILYEYLRFLGEKRPEADDLRARLETETDEAGKQKLEAQLEALNEKVQAYQENLVSEHAGSLVAAVIKANMPVFVPEFEDSDGEDAQIKKWRYSQKHYFDHIDLADPRLLRTPFLFDRVDTYVHKMVVQHPDTIARAIERVLEQMKPAEETLQFYLVHYLNEAAGSKIVGMDAVYVHLVNTYYKSGIAHWTDEEQLEKILDNARSLEPLLIGKVAPDIEMQKRYGSKIRLHEVESPYTVLYFWRYDCGVCKKSTPHMKTFYEEYKDKGVTLFAVCAKLTDEVPECWEYVDEKGIQDWLHTVDPYNRSRFMGKYYLKSTPQVYILDEEKKILSKRIGAEQLGEVIERLMEIEQEKKAGQG